MKEAIPEAVPERIPEAVSVGIWDEVHAGIPEKVFGVFSEGFPK